MDVALFLIIIMSAFAKVFIEMGFRGTAMDIARRG